MSTSTLLQHNAGHAAPSGDSHRRLRVCHVSLTLCTGGLERLLADFARLHDRSQFELEFLAIEETGRFAAEIAGQGCVVRQLAKKGRVARIREMARLFRDRGYDVIHTHNNNPHVNATLAARLAGIPVVVNTRHGRNFGQSWTTRLQSRVATALCDRMVAVSDDAARLSSEGEGIPANKVTRIWNGIDLEQFPWHGSSRKPVAISVGRMTPEKDFPTLLRAVKIALTEVPRLRVRIVGDGPERAHVEAVRRDLGLEDAVQLLGERKDVPELLAGAGFYVGSSISEGISLTLLEAMATGLPVVTTTAGGNPEIVVNDVTGRLVPPSSPASLALAIVEMCRDRDRWEEFGLNGRDRVAKHFEIRRMVAEYESLYEQLLAAKKGVKA